MGTLATTKTEKSSNETKIQNVTEGTAFLTKKLIIIGCRSPRVSRDIFITQRKGSDPMA